MNTEMQIFLIYNVQFRKQYFLQTFITIFLEIISFLYSSNFSTNQNLDYKMCRMFFEICCRNFSYS